MTHTNDRRRVVRDGINARRLGFVTEAMPDQLTPVDRQGAAALLAHVVSAPTGSGQLDPERRAVDVLIAEALVDGRLVELLKAMVVISLDILGRTIFNAHRGIVPTTVDPILCDLQNMAAIAAAAAAEQMNHEDPH